MSKHHKSTDPLAPGDRVIAIANVKRRPGPRRDCRYRTSGKQRLIARVVQVQGQRVTVKDHSGNELTVMRSMVRYEPTQKILSQRVKLVRASRFDESLRSSLGLPLFVWPEVREPWRSAGKDLCDA